jgi:hypothetical protein
MPAAYRLFLSGLFWNHEWTKSTAPALQGGLSGMRWGRSHYPLSDPHANPEHCQVFPIGVAYFGMRSGLFRPVPPVRYWPVSEASGLV